MRSFLIFWAGPLGFLWGWYFLSYYDLSMGMYFFSRDMHDLVFRIYGNVLGLHRRAFHHWLREPVSSTPDWSCLSLHSAAAAKS